MTSPSTIAHYRITGKLGEGGMGAVYRATDTKLNRDIAIKVLPDAFANDPDRLARFTREAQVLASLNHPNIAAIYGVEQRALVMELVQGPTLAERIAQGPIPWDEALPLIRQLIDALEYAHEKGVIHRDLKPANLKVTPDGRLKVLDFGLAKALAGETPGGDPASSPTLTMRATMAGTIMGTAGYMAPEQARGYNVDKRADIWAFGTVLYEMLTGTELFVGPTITDTLAAVLRHEPDLTGLPAGARRLAEQCLVRDPRARLRDIGDARLLLNAPVAVPVPAPAGNPYRWVALALAVVAAVALWAPWRSAAPVNRPLTRFRVDLGPDAVAGPRSTAAISPDGRRLAFTVRAAGGKTLLATQGLDQAKPTPLADTDGASDPFFSPDGKWIGFQAKGKLQKIPVDGGNPQELADAINARGATWGEDGTIIFTPATNTGLYRVSENGGGAQKLTEPSATNEQVHRWPQILPGGQAVLFTGHSQPTAFDTAQLEVLSLATRQWKAVSPGGYFGRYLPGGYLVYVRRGTLFGVRFDADKLAVRGAPVSLIDDLAASSFSAAGQFDFSRDGTLVYLSGKGLDAWPVTIVDRSGSVQTQIAPPFNYSGVRLSPDGKRIALVGVPGADADLWIQDLELGSTARLTFSGKVTTGCWSPDGKHILYSTGKTLWWVRADGAGQPDKLLDTAEAVAPHAFSPDGRRLALATLGPKTGTLILTLDVSDPEHPKAGALSDVIVGPQPSFSPRPWLAHISNESGSTEVFVRPFPGPGGKWQISFGGGFYPTWSADGRQLYYLNATAHLMAVDYTVKGDSFTTGQSREFTPHPTILTGITPPYAVFPDGKRVAMYLPETRNDTGSVHVTVLLNFFDEVRRRIP